MPDLIVVILAAGQGTRMRSRVPKMLHPLCGRPLVGWPIAAALAAGADDVVVVDSPGNTLEGHLPDGVTTAVQPTPNGTGGAVQAAAEHIDARATVVVLPGDAPLVTADAIAALVATHTAQGAAATMATMRLDDPTGYGRVVRDADGNVERVVETKTAGDATDEELAIDEVNSSIFAFDGMSLLEVLDDLEADNAQGELYLPDVLPALRARGKPVAAHDLGDPALALGVNDRVQLAAGARDRPAAHPRRARPRRRDDRRPRIDAHRRERHDRGGHDDRAELVPARLRPPSAPAARSAR